MYTGRYRTFSSVVSRFPFELNSSNNPMGFALTLFYLFVTLLTPAEVIPFLLPYRIMLVLLIIKLVASVFSVLSYRFSFKAPQLYLLLGLAGYAALTVLWAVRYITGAVDAVLELMFLLGISLMVCWTVGTLVRLRILVGVLTVVNLVIVAQGVAAIELGYREKEFLLQQGQDPDAHSGVNQTYVNRIRGLGVLNDPNDLAQCLIVNMALLGCCWAPRRAGRNALLVIIPGTLLLIGVALTRSRGAVLSLVVMTIMLLQKRLGKFGFALGGIVGLVFVGAMTFLTGRNLSLSEDSTAGRLDAWYAGMQMFKDSPILGVGFNRFLDHHDLTAHNSYMLCIAELGFPGFLIWLAIIVSSVFQMRSLSLLPDTVINPALKAAARSAYTALIMFAVSAWFLSRSYTTILFLIIGIAIAVMEMARREGIVPNAKGERVWKMATVGIGCAILAVIYMTVRVRGLVG
jgi:putative inorganic carbon (hco3(-)) transporter